MSLLRGGFGGTQTLHELKAMCDLCAQEADSEVSEVVALDCTFSNCPSESAMYHQSCLEKYLKGQKCEKNRKIGFLCPRGAGKTSTQSRCVGKIVKSHPVSIRSEGNKKRRQAELDQLQRANTADNKQDPKNKTAKKDEAAASSKKEDKYDKKGAAKASTKPIVIKALNTVNKPITPAVPKKTPQQLEREKLAAAAQNLKNEIAAKQGGGGASSSSSSSLTAKNMVPLASKPLPKKEKQVMTLDEYLNERSNSSLASMDRATSRASSNSSSVVGGDKTASGAAAALPVVNPWNRGSSHGTAAGAATGTTTTNAANIASGSGSGNNDDGGSGSYSGAASTSTTTSVSRNPSVPPTPHNSRQTSGSATPVPLQQHQQPLGAWAQQRKTPLTITTKPLSASMTSLTSPTHTSEHNTNNTLIPGMESPMHLSRAQKKNLKRAEKKAAARTDECSSIDAVSVADTLPESDEVSHVSYSTADLAAVGALGGGLMSHMDSISSLPPVFEGQVGGCSDGNNIVVVDGSSGVGSSEAIGDSPMERCLKLVVQHKLNKAVESLQEMGYSGPMAVAAVKESGGDVQSALTSLLANGGNDHHHHHHHPSWNNTTTTTPHRYEDVNIHDELTTMHTLQTTYNLPPGAVEAVVEDTHGDINAAASLLAERYAPVSPQSSILTAATVSPPSVAVSPLVGNLQTAGGTNTHFATTEKHQHHYRYQQQQGHVQYQYQQQQVVELSMHTDGHGGVNGGNGGGGLISSALTSMDDLGGSWSLDSGDYSAGSYSLFGFGGGLGGGGGTVSGLNTTTTGGTINNNTTSGVAPLTGFGGNGVNVGSGSLSSGLPSSPWAGSSPASLHNNNSQQQQQHALHHHFAPMSPDASPMTNTMNNMYGVNGGNSSSNNNVHMGLPGGASASSVVEQRLDRGVLAALGFSGLVNSPTSSLGGGSPVASQQQLHLQYNHQQHQQQQQQSQSQFGGYQQQQQQYQTQQFSSPPQQQQQQQQLSVMQAKQHYGPIGSLNIISNNNSTSQYVNGNGGGSSFGNGSSTLPGSLGSSFNSNHVSLTAPPSPLHTPTAAANNNNNSNNRFLTGPTTTTTTTTNGVPPLYHQQQQQSSATSMYQGPPPPLTPPATGPQPSLHQQQWNSNNTINNVVGSPQRQPPPATSAEAIRHLWGNQPVTSPQSVFGAGRGGFGGLVGGGGGHQYGIDEGVELNDLMSALAVGGR